MRFLGLLSLAGSLIATVAAASLQEVTNFGPNPTNTRMFIYVPDNLPSGPRPLLVGAHWCSGSANAFYSGTQYATLANTYGYIVIYPQAPDPGGCWDVHTTATLTHDGGGDSLGVASQVRYVIANYNINTSRIYVTGISSGGMLTNVLLGAYPDLFAAGASVAGVPFGCFAGPNMWNSVCSQGQLIQTGAQWGDLVRAAYPGYTGPRPKMMLWHGVLDDVLYYQNFLEAIKQWTNVFGISETPTTTQTNTPYSQWTKTTYGSGQVVALSGAGQGHSINVYMDPHILAFFGLDNTTPSSSTTTTRSSTTTTTRSSTTTTTRSSTTTPTSRSSSTSTTSTGVGSPRWGQCAGIGWTGPQTCQSPWVCTFFNDWYSQCL